MLHFDRLTMHTRDQFHNVLLTFIEIVIDVDLKKVQQLVLYYLVILRMFITCITTRAFITNTVSDTDWH